MPKPYSGVTTNAGPVVRQLVPRESTLYPNSAGSSTIQGAEIFFASGVGASGYFRPNVASLRDCIQTLNGVSSVLASTPVGLGMQVRIISEVFGKRTDVIGDSAWFLLRAVYINVANSLVEISAPTVISSGNAGSSLSWTAELVAVGTSLQTHVQGESGKTVHWAIIREQIEVR